MKIGKLLFWGSLGLGALWLLTKSKDKLPTTGLTLTAGAQKNLTLQYSELAALAQAKFPTVRNVSITQEADGSLTFTAETLDSGGAPVTIPLFTAKNADDARRQIAAA